MYKKICFIVFMCFFSISGISICHGMELDMGDDMGVDMGGDLDVDPVREPHRGSCTNSLQLNNGESCSHRANTYQFTLKGFGLRRSDGTVIWLVNQTKTFNAAGRNINEEMGTYIFNGTLPEGTFDAIIPELGDTMTASPQSGLRLDPGGMGAVDVPAEEVTKNFSIGTVCPDNGIPVDSNTPCWDNRRQAFHILHQDGFSPFTIGPNSRVDLEMGFDTSAGVKFNSNGANITGELGDLNVTMIPRVLDSASAG